MFQRLVIHWGYGALPTAILLLALLPLVSYRWPVVLTATFLTLPVYMFHQYEEHDNDRFRRFFNTVIAHGKEILTPLDCFVINVPIVWGYLLISLYLVACEGTGYGLIAFYLLLVNAIAHIAWALIFRSYNPGLITAVLLFLPLSIYGIGMIDMSGAGSLRFHLIGAAAGIGVHVGLITFARTRGLKFKKG